MSWNPKPKKSNELEKGLELVTETVILSNLSGVVGLSFLPFSTHASFTLSAKKVLPFYCSRSGKLLSFSNWFHYASY